MRDQNKSTMIVPSQIRFALLHLCIGAQGETSRKSSPARENAEKPAAGTRDGLDVSKKMHRGRKRFQCPAVSTATFRIPSAVTNSSRPLRAIAMFAVYSLAWPKDILGGAETEMRFRPGGHTNSTGTC
jgi:hypothetical protein